MKISSSFKTLTNVEPYSYLKNIPKNPTYMPEWIGSVGKWAGEYVSMPEQKLFLAATALMFQPLIDMKFADDDKKADVAIKSASKAIAGGLTGVTIRGVTENYLNSKIGYTRAGFRKQNRINDLLFPPKAAKKFKVSRTEAEVSLKKYSTTLSIMFALAFMALVTNEALDVPITSDLQDLFSGVIKEKKTWSKSFYDVIAVRTRKIKKWSKEKYYLIKNKAKQFIDVLKHPRKLFFKDEQPNNIAESVKKTQNTGFNSGDFIK